MFGTEADQHVVSLESEHHADGDAAQADDDQRENAKLIEFPHVGAQPQGRRHHRRGDSAGEDGHFAKLLDEVERPATEL